MIAVIPARGGSTRIPRKNVREFHGKPILAYSIETAKAFGFRRVVVTTDDEEIGAVAAGCGAEVLTRPADMARDEVGTQEVARHAIETLLVPSAWPVCVIYATAPLMWPADLERGWQALQRYHTYFAMSVGTEPLRDAGQWYWGRAGAFGKVPLVAEHTVMVPIPESRVCDVNVEADWAEALTKYARMNEST